VNGNGVSIESLTRFIVIPNRCELGRNGTFCDTKGAGDRSEIISPPFVNMRTCTMNHGQWYKCQCPVVYSGGEPAGEPSKGCSHAGMQQRAEPRRGRMKCVSGEISKSDAHSGEGSRRREAKPYSAG
jgi:hypothetical protein